MATGKSDSRCPHSLYETRWNCLKCHNCRHVLRTNPFNCQQAKLENYTCDECDFETYVKVSFIKHLRSGHDWDIITISDIEGLNVKAYSCGNCDFETFSTLMLLRHQGICSQKHSKKKRKKKKRKKLIVIRAEHKKSQKFSNRSKKTAAKNNVKVRKTIVRRQFSKVKQGPKARKCDRPVNVVKLSSLSTGDYETRYSNGVKVFDCKLCYHRTKYFQNLRRHYYVRHQNPVNTKSESVSSAVKMSELSARDYVTSYISGVKLFDCKWCPHRTKYYHNLRRHFYVRHQNPKQRRSLTKKNSKALDVVSLSTSDFTTRWSNGVKVFDCQLCGHTTKYYQNLRRHFYERHLSKELIQWFECGQCPYKCKQEGNLRKHMQSKHSKHSNKMAVKQGKPSAGCKRVKWHKCDQCTFRSKMKLDLKNHVNRTHGVMKIHRCHLCSFTTAYYHNCLRHVAKMHQES